MPATAELLLTGTLTDVPGVTATFTSTHPDAKLAVFLSARFQNTGTAVAGTEYVALAVLDGVETAHPAFWMDNGLAKQGLTAFGMTAVSPLSPGTHELKMMAKRLLGTGTGFKLLLAPTSMTYILIDT